MKWSRILALSALMAATYMVTAGSSSAGAVSGSGYFTGRSINVNPISVRNNDVLSGSTMGSDGSRSGYAVPGNIDTKQKVYNWLQSRYNSSAKDSRDRIGATFIVKTMIGVSAGTSGSPVSKSLSSADWAELDRRLVQNPNIRVRYVNGDPNGYGNGQVSFYGGGGSGNNGGETFFANYAKGNVPLLIIEDTSNGTRYVLERYCANPVGGLSLNAYDPPRPWTVSGTTSRTVNGADTGTAAPGQVVRWTHTLRLNTNSNNAGINSHMSLSGFSNGWNSSHFGSSTVAAGRPTGVIRTISPATGNRTLYTVTQNDVGNNLCQRFHWAPARNTGGSGATGLSCINVPYNYNLQPSISPNSSFSGGVVEPGTSVGLERIVRNAGPTKSSNSEWRMTEIIVEPGVSVPNAGGGAGSEDPCSSYFRPSAGSCNQIAVHTNRVFNPNITSLGSVDRTVGDLPAGARICWGLSVRARTHSDGRWQHSPLVCLYVGKKPKVQFWGGDVRSSEDVITSSLIREGRIYGSWAEYAIITSQEASSASGAGLSGGPEGRDLADLTRRPFDFNHLTFSNTGSALGGFSDVPASMIPAQFAVASGPMLSGERGADDLDGSYQATNIILTGGTIAAGRKVQINATGTVTIRGNIAYENVPYGTIGSMSQLVINARNIVIESDVTELDAWLIARPGVGAGYVSTCGPVAAPGNWLSGLGVDPGAPCSAPLKINGPVMADRLYLRRTFGAEGGNPGAPAEILNLRPDTYMWSYGVARNSSAVQTMYLRELPPRF